MRGVMIAGVAVCLLSACAGVGPQPPRSEAYEGLLARARGGDAEAAIWCAMIRNVKPAAYEPYAARCAEMTKSLTPAELQSANAIAAQKVAHKTAG